MAETVTDEKINEETTAKKIYVEVYQDQKVVWPLVVIKNDQT